MSDVINGHLFISLKLDQSGRLCSTLTENERVEIENGIYKYIPSLFINIINTH